MEGNTIYINSNVYLVINLLGKGKGGYSYLVSDGHDKYVIKQIHHEPCDYYSFGNKLESEINDYEILNNLGIPMPKMIEIDYSNERILKEYIKGETVAQLLDKKVYDPSWIKQIKDMCDILYPAGINIDYYPTNFVLNDKTLFYIDYECNQYIEEWDFEHWGIQYWSIK